MAQKDHCQPAPCFPPQEPQAFGSHPPGPVDSVPPFTGLRAWCLVFLSQIWVPVPPGGNVAVWLSFFLSFPFACPLQLLSPGGAQTRLKSLLCL